MKRVAVKFNDLLDAFEFVSAAYPTEHEAYLCVATGTILYHAELGVEDEPLPDEIDDPERYIAIPHKNELDLISDG